MIWKESELDELNVKKYFTAVGRERVFLLHEVKVKLFSHIQIRNIELNVNADFQSQLELNLMFYHRLNTLLKRVSCEYATSRYSLNIN